MNNIVPTCDEIELTDAQLESICGADGMKCGADGVECEIPVVLLAKLKVKKIFCFQHSFPGMGHREREENMGRVRHHDLGESEFSSEDPDSQL